jgi:thiamine phosphate synthase YjbQ (UPF0047 family)
MQPLEHLLFDENLPRRTLVRDFNTTRVLQITPYVEAAVRKSGLREGLVLVNGIPITASVYNNHHEQGLL